MTTTEAMAATADRPRRRRLPGRRRERAAGKRIAALFEEHGRLVYGVCRLMLRDPVEAEDAAQQTFLSAYRALLGGQEPREASAWLGTIARNECRTRLRGRRTEPLTLVREPVGEELQREVDRHDEIQALCTALAALPPRHRDAIVLREFYGLSYAEVGAALGLSGAAVESVIFRSRKQLQDLLRPARSALGVLTLPVSLRDSIAQLLPGFGGAGASAGGAAVFAKFASAPLTAKLVAATLAVGAAGTAAGIEHAHVVRHHRGHAPAPARLAVVRRAPVTAPREVAASAARTPATTPVAVERIAARHRGEAVADTHSGPGGGEPERQAATEGSSSGPGPGGTDGVGESHSGPSSGSGSGESGSGGSGSGDSHSGHDGSGGDGSDGSGSGSGGSGSGDSGSGSGGSGSGDPGD